MGTFGSIKEYEQSEDWIQYQERLENYFDANDITEEGKNIYFTQCSGSPGIPADKEFSCSHKTKGKVF